MAYKVLWVNRKVGRECFLARRWADRWFITLVTDDLIWKANRKKIRNEMVFCSHSLFNHSSPILKISYKKCVSWWVNFALECLLEHGSKYFLESTTTSEDFRKQRNLVNNEICHFCGFVWLLAQTFRAGPFEKSILVTARKMRKNIICSAKN